MVLATDAPSSPPAEPAPSAAPPLALPHGYAAILVTAGVAGELLKLPYSLAVMRQVQPEAVAAQPHPLGYMVNTAIWLIFFYAVVHVGLRLGRSLGLGWPPLDGWNDGQARAPRIRAALTTAVLAGAICAATLLALGALWGHLFAAPAVDIQMPHWSSALLASLGAGMSEEILHRLGLLTLFAWLGNLALGRRLPRPAILWSANLAATLLFALFHLPQTVQMGSFSGPMLAFVLIGNGVVGLVFGWLYWRKGILAAVVAHASTNIVHKVLWPLLFL